MENLNAAAATEKKIGKKSIILLMMEQYKRGDYGPHFNNAAQVFNHEFFWDSMKPNGGGKPDGALLSAIENSFETFDNFLDNFKSAGSPAASFGSGWVWLVKTPQGLQIQFSQNAENPLVCGSGTPLLV